MNTEARAIEVEKEDSPVNMGGNQLYDGEGNIVEPQVAAVAEVIKGEVQPEAFRDKPYAFLFVVQVIGVVGTAIALAPKAFSLIDVDVDTGDDAAAVTDDAGDYSGDGGGATPILFGATLSFVASVLLTLGGLNMMTRHAASLVKISFFLAPGMFLLLAFFAIIAGDDISVIFLGVAVFLSLITLCCWFFYKKHVAFAASNLLAALSAVRVNYGLYLISMVTSFVLWVWSVVWVIAIMGVAAKAEDKPQVPCSQYATDDYQSHDGMCDQPPNQIGMIVLLFCFYWTHQVIQNVLHTTTAGTVGTWWFTPLGDSAVCSEAVSSSLYRACTYSFGSICFGSMLVAILQTLEQVAKSARNNRRGGGGLLLCIVECLLHLLRAWLEYFNSWAFVYVGLYGYDYLTAGKNVINLFKARGWTTLIADRLVFRVLMFCNLGIAALSGCVGLIIGAVMGAGMESDDATAMRMTMTIIALLTGLFTSSAVLFVVESAVRTVIVCFAESPAEFQEHHPNLSEAMQSGWAQAYPTIYSPGPRIVV